MVHFCQFLLLPSLLLVNFASVIPHPRSSNPAIHTIYEFSNETWVENTAVRSNSNLLLNILSTPSFYELNPFDSTPGSARLLHTFSFATGLGGIAEI
jgi:hypothetical protein